MANEELHQTIGEVKATVKAAHSRIDKLEVGLRDDLGKIMGKLETIEAWMHSQKAYAAALVFVAGILGGAISLLAKFLF